MLVLYKTVKEQVDVKKRLDRIIVFEIEGNDAGSQGTAYVLSCPVFDVEPPKPLVHKTDFCQGGPRESGNLARRVLRSMMHRRIWQRAVTITLVTEGGEAYPGFRTPLSQPTRRGSGSVELTVLVPVLGRPAR